MNHRQTKSDEMILLCTEQIEENVAAVVRLKHTNYEEKIWHHYIADNVPSTSR
jgi:hypothetical protein